MTDPTATATSIRAAQAAAAHEAARHERPLLEEAATLLAQIQPLAERLGEIAPALLTGYVPIHLTSIAADHGRAVQAVTSALAAVPPAGVFPGPTKIEGDLIVEGSV